ncbi:MAG: non-heme iron oxygenase ferredoxin subunit [Calditrichota bacterium]
MSDWQKVMSESEFGGTASKVEIAGYEIALFKLADGFYAIDDECSHDIASLSEGDIVDDCKIECPRHGALFDIRNGECLTPPALIDVKSYPVKIEGGDIYIDLA